MIMIMIRIKKPNYQEKKLNDSMILEGYNKTKETTHIHSISFDKN